MKRAASGGRPVGLSLLVGLVLFSQATWSEDAVIRASAMLDRMADALRSLNYEGTLVYLHDNRLEALHLIHRIDQGRIEERLSSLNGPVRAVTRERDRVMCVLPDGHPISVKREPGGGSLLNAEGIDPMQLQDYYRIEIQGVSRVAGRETEVVGIIPRDDLRYGYRFYIDRETSLPLKSDLIDRGEQSLEQLMFTAVTVDPVGSAALSPPATPLRETPAAEIDGRWRFEDPPAGFRLVKQGVMEPPGGARVEHFLFTDRLSAYSVYIEANTEGGLSGSTHIGAVHAAGRQVDGYQVTAVGEVPAETVAAAVSGAGLIDLPSQ